ncbi:hypothetical protein AVEN_168349-1 [Araneus ventricosus]|uniref:Uncharacterized protein n=1 Tax=Araneus ventricosus TaxID=182803 RepID=A0A4Y2MCD2_ARAVE|nr:hypothetical protein AVEN_168349-1 [Araneus ventricosus]
MVCQDVLIWKFTITPGLLYGVVELHTVPIFSPSTGVRDSRASPSPTGTPIPYGHSASSPLSPKMVLPQWSCGFHLGERASISLSKHHISSILARFSKWISSEVGFSKVSTTSLQFSSDSRIDERLRSTTTEFRPCGLTVEEFNSPINGQKCERMETSPFTVKRWSNEKKYFINFAKIKFFQLPAPYSLFFLTPSDCGLDKKKTVKFKE